MNEPLSIAGVDDFAEGIKQIIENNHAMVDLLRELAREYTYPSDEYHCLNNYAHKALRLLAEMGEKLQ